MVKPRCWAKSRLARIEHRCDAGQALQNRRFEIVDHDFGRHAQGREGMLVAGEEVLHGLGDGSWRMSRNRSRPGSAATPVADVARMFWPSRSNRSVVRKISSCNGVPTICAIKPIKTAGCAVKIFCNGGHAAWPVLIAESMGCAIERSCNAGPTQAGARVLRFHRWRCHQGQRRQSRGRSSSVQR